MIIIPEIQTVVILVPRTASGSLYRAIQETYPKSMLLYRHMEADGLPMGYERWRRVGVVRNPIDRLWSLYKFLQDFNGNHHPEYIKKMRSSVAMSFSEWVLNNEVVFTSPYCRSGELNYYPRYAVRHPLPENRKSQHFYLRPDLGTEIFQFSRLDSFAEVLGVELGLTNKTKSQCKYHLTSEAMSYMQHWFEWDFSVTEAA